VGTGAFDDLLTLQGRAYHLAARILDSSSQAEDAVQQAYLKALQHPPNAVPPAELRTWFLTVVANTARDLRRRRAARKRREAKVISSTESAASGAKPHLRVLLQGAVAALDEKYRVPICLCYEQDLSQREAAAVLDMPERTISKYVNVGLAKLRKALERAGYPAAVAAVLGGLKQTAPAVPASLAGRVEALVAKGAVKAGTSAAAASVSAAAKGGIAMKLVAGVVLAGAIAGMTAVSMSGRGGGGGGALPAEKPKSKFSTPIWHPEARWEKAENWAATHISGNLDGPRREIMWRRGFGSRVCNVYPIVFPQGGGPYPIHGYDAKAERIHAVACGGRGFMDGPFSRARWGGFDYSHLDSLALTPDRRYFVLRDAWNGCAIRVFDLKEQVVRTILPPQPYKARPQGVAGDSKGRIFVLLAGGRLLTVDATSGWKPTETKLKATAGLDLKRGAGLAYDEKHNRLYASGWMTEHAGKKWHVWYFDLNDGGSFHGVLAGERKGPGPAYAGPFDTFKGYGECSIGFGPDDPDFRFLYVRTTDTSTFQRLDLEKRVVAACSGAPRHKTGPVSFIESGTPNATSAHLAAVWLPNGDFIMPGVRQSPATLFRRVK